MTALNPPCRYHLPPGPAPIRRYLALRPGAAPEIARLAANAVISCLMSQQRILAEHYKMDYDQLAVYLVIANGAVQRSIRKPEPGSHLETFEPLEYEDLGVVSRRAVAEATGLPRETVRRMFDKMTANGRLVTVTDNKSGEKLLTTEYFPLESRPTRKYTNATVRMANQLSRLGIVTVQDRATAIVVSKIEADVSQAFDPGRSGSAALDSPFVHAAGQSARSTLVEGNALDAMILAEENFTSKARLVSYATINDILEQLRLLADHSGMSYNELVVYIWISLATVQETSQIEAADQLPTPDSPIPFPGTGSISRRAVAAATGLPRETARRIITGLLANGHVTPVGRNFVASPFLTELPAQSQIMSCLEKAVQIINTLLRLDVMVFSDRTARRHPWPGDSA